MVCEGRGEGRRGSCTERYIISNKQLKTRLAAPGCHRWRCYFCCDSRICGRENVTNTIRITNTLTQQAGRQTGRQLFQLIYTHVCVCVRVCVAGWELAAAGRAKRVCKVTGVLSLCSRRQNEGRRQTSLTNVSYAYKAHLSHIPMPRSPHSMRPSLSCWFFTTLCCVPAAGRAIKTVARSVCMPAGCSYYRLFKQNASSLHRQPVSFSLSLCLFFSLFLAGQPFHGP